MSLDIPRMMEAGAVIYYCKPGYKVVACIELVKPGQDPDNEDAGKYRADVFQRRRFSTGRFDVYKDAETFVEDKIRNVPWTQEASNLDELYDQVLKHRSKLK